MIFNISFHIVFYPRMNVVLSCCFETEVILVMDCNLYYFNIHCTTTIKEKINNALSLGVPNVLVFSCQMINSFEGTC